MGVPRATLTHVPGRSRDDRDGSRWPRWAAGLIGLLIVLGVWELLGLTVFSSSGIVPPPTAIVSQMTKDGWHFYWPNLQTTMQEAAYGWLWGNALAIALAVAFLAVPIIEKPLIRLSVVTYCLPIIAVGTIFQIVFKGQTPKIILAAMSVFFTTLIGMLVGLRSADPTSLELVHCYGGGRIAQLVKVRLKVCLPNLFAALRIAAPAAVLGAIIGEYLGGENGLGVAMINSEQALQVERTWGIALVATLVAGLGYAATAFIGRRLTPWAKEVAR